MRTTKLCLLSCCLGSMRYCCCCYLIAETFYAQRSCRKFVFRFVSRLALGPFTFAARVSSHCRFHRIYTNHFGQQPESPISMSSLVHSRLISSFARPIIAHKSLKFWRCSKLRVLPKSTANTRLGNFDNLAMAASATRHKHPSTISQHNVMESSH